MLDDPVLHHRQAIGIAERRLTMRDDHDRRLARLRGGDRIAQGFLALAVERGVGLVEDQDLGIAIERARQGDALRLSTRERSEEHTSELQSLMRISYAVFCLKKKKHK